MAERKPGEGRPSDRKASSKSRTYKKKGLTTQDDAVSEAWALLRQFVVAMNEWEVGYDRDFMSDLDPEKVKKDALKRLKDIHRQFCAAESRPSRATQGLHASSPPDYDPASTELLRSEVSADDGTVTLWTTQRRGTPLEAQYVYTLVLERAGWRVQDNKQRVRPNGSLAPWNL